MEMDIPSNFTNLPIELTLKIISFVNYIDVLQLSRVSKNFKHIIEENSMCIYKQLRHFSKEIDDYFRIDQCKESNYSIFSIFYTNEIKRRKQALIILRYIHKWLTTELIDSPMDRSIINKYMIVSVRSCLLKLFKRQKASIDENLLYQPNRANALSIDNFILMGHRSLKTIIEKYVLEELLYSININRIVVDGFTMFETYNVDCPKLYIYNKGFTCKKIYKIKLHYLDTKLFVD